MKISIENSYKRFTRFVAETFSISLFAFIVIVQCYNIFSRYTKIGFPMAWVEEFSRYSFIWITFFLWHLSQREGDHFVVDIIPNKLKGKPKFLLEIFISLVIIIFTFLLIYSSWLYIPSTMTYCAQSFRRIPMGIFYTVIPIGIVFVLIEEVIILSNKVKIWGKGTNKQ